MTHNRRKRLFGIVIDETDPLWQDISSGKIMCILDRNILKAHYKVGAPMSEIARAANVTPAYVRKVIVYFWHYCAMIGDRYDKLYNRLVEGVGDA